MALGTFRALISKLFYDVEILVCEPPRVDQKIPFLLERRLLSLRTKRN